MTIAIDINPKQAIRAVTPEWLLTAQLIWRRTLLWRKIGLIFVHIPKNGGMAINTALYGRFMGHMTAMEIAHWAPRSYARFPKVAVSRNPWGRVLSAYRFAKAGAGAGRGARIAHPKRYCIPEFATFESFVHEWLAEKAVCNEDYVFRPQVDFILREDGTLGVNHLGKLEQLGSTKQYIEQQIRKHLDIPFMNYTRVMREYRNHYTRPMKEIVERVYRDDIEYFRYEF